ncbi:MAG: hypothetical protein VX877_15070, partial [Planctomycetota bacterium]|nr:hypothetical protein [Planctomycetota bacterium]
MNTETRNTLCFAAAAVVCTALAIAVNTGGVPAGQQAKNLGTPFYDDFDAVNDARELEVIVFTKGQTAPSKFRVVQDQTTRRYVIPTHHNYEADAKDRLAKT